MINLKKINAFTIAEMLVALAIMAIILTAVAVALNASAINYNENAEMFNAMNTARQAMLRMTNQFRTAEEVIVAASETNPAIQCSFKPANSNQLSEFHYYNAAHTVGGKSHPANTLCFNTNGNHYLLCNHVSAFTFTRTEVAGTVTSVQLSMRVTVGNDSQTINGAAVLRKKLN